MREHGTRACYVFGTKPGNDRTKGCHCVRCRAANAAYQLRRDRAARRPDELLEPAYVDAGPARAHLLDLQAAGLGRREISRRAGVVPSVVVRIRSGDIRRVRPATRERILAVTADRAAAGALVAAGPTWALVNDLLAAGVGRARVGRAVTANPNAKALQLGRHWITQRSADRVAALYAEVVDGDVGPEPEPGTPQHFAWFLRRRRRWSVGA